MIKWSVLLLTLLSAAANAATWNIYYPRPLTEADQRTQFPVALLTLALEQTGVKYKLYASERLLTQTRALKQLANNREVNVVWSMTDKTREAELLPIRIPIFKGLAGWRIFLVRNDNIPAFSAISDFSQLMNLKPVQGADWPDTKILQNNGFEVVTSKSYLELFDMLAKSQGDFFPRSVTEIWHEVDKEEIDERIEVEPKFGLRYPTAMYFFVNKRNTTLARLINNGLEKAIENGSFDRLFIQHHSAALTRANMLNRRFFNLENPLLPEDTPIDRAELWYQPNLMQKTN